MQNKVTVRIAGLSYTIVGEESAAYIQEIAEAAEKTIREAHSAARGSTLEAAVLSVLNLTDEKNRQHSEALGLREELSRRGDQLEQLRRGEQDACKQRDALQEQVDQQQQTQDQMLQELQEKCARLQKETNDAKAELGRLRAQQNARKAGQ